MRLLSFILVLSTFGARHAAAAPAVSLADLQQYLGDYALDDVRRGSCSDSMTVGVAGISKNSGAILSIGGYLFPALNLGWQEFSNRDGGITRTNSKITMNFFTGRPILRSHVEHDNRSMGHDRQEVEVRALSGDRMQVETEKTAYSRANGRSHVASKCIYVKSAGGSDNQGQGQGKGQGQGQGQGQK